MAQFSFTAIPKVEIFNRLGTAPVPQNDLQYWRGTGISMAYTGVDPKGNLAGSCPSVLVRYWTSVQGHHWNLYWISTGITPKSVISRHLVSGLGLYYASTTPTLVPVPTVQYRHCSLLTTGAVLSFVNTGVNPTFPPGTYDLINKNLDNFFEIFHWNVCGIIEIFNKFFRLLSKYYE